ncbi:hypothetical protein SCHAM137S_02014 [Streptomyces chartreusis]
MQRQIDGEEAERHAANGPVFALIGHWIEGDRQGQPRAKVRLVQRSGPALSSVLVTVSGNDVDGIRPDPEDMSVVSSLDLGESSAGAELEFCVGLEYQHVPPVQVAVRIDCQARDTAATWTRDLADSVTQRSAVTRTFRRR